VDDLSTLCNLFKSIIETILPVLKLANKKYAGFVAILVALVIVGLFTWRAVAPAQFTVPSSSGGPMAQATSSPTATETAPGAQQIGTGPMSTPQTSATTPPAPLPSSAVFVTKSQIIEDDALNVVVRMVTMPSECERLFIEISHWYSPHDDRDYQKPMLVCSDSPHEFDRIIVLGTGDVRDCGQRYELNVVSIPESVYQEWRREYIDRERPITAQPEPDGTRRLTNLGITMTIGGPRCAKPTPTAIVRPPALKPATPTSTPIAK